MIEISICRAELHHSPINVNLIPSQLRCFVKSVYMTAAYRFNELRNPESQHILRRHHLKAGLRWRILLVCTLNLANFLAASQKALAQQVGAPATTEVPSHGSVSVPMDSWIYPALERLGGMGLIGDQNLGIRPWSRTECLRQSHLAAENLDSLSPAQKEVAERLIKDLVSDLAPDSQPNLVLDSVYVRYGNIIGPALSDSFHFGQTVWNDFGRPLGRGGSSIYGVSARFTSGHFFFYTRNELQQAPTSAGISAKLSSQYQTLDIVPTNSYIANAYPVSPAKPASVRLTPLELYAGARFLGSQLSFGKQSLFWGPNRMGPLSFSLNAEPTYNLQLSSAYPHKIPFAPWLGEFQYNFVIGKLSGHTYPRRPYFNGQKVSFNLRNTLEVGFTRWSILWGVGHPMTLGSLKRNLFSANSTGNSFRYGERSDPGDRKSAFDFTFHVPGLSRYLTIYTDSYADDEPSPIDAPRRVAWSPGLYLSNLPGAPNWDFRFEVASTQELSEDEGGVRFYINNQYINGNTNKGFLLGNAVGRDGRAFQGWITYWKSARTSITGSYRQTKQSTRFLDGGGTVSDAQLQADTRLRSALSLHVFTQYERSIIPMVDLVDHHNFTVHFQLKWSPNISIPLKMTRP